MKRSLMGRALGTALLGLALTLSAPSLSTAQPHFQERQGWTLQCQVDAMFDTCLCVAWKGHLFVSLGGTQVLVYIYEVHMSRYPGTPMLLRFDDLPPVSTPAVAWDGGEATALIARMHTASTARTRYTAWPTKYTHDSTVDLAGFAEVWAALQYGQAHQGQLPALPAPAQAQR